MKGAPTGLFGGTFNPVHYGHLRSALELRDALGLAEVRLMPTAQPPHRAAPECGPSVRADLVSLAIAGEPGLSCDRRELNREGPSYTVDSLRELRTELGPDASVCLIIGADAFAMLDSWHQWRDIIDLAHIVVLARPGWEVPQAGSVAQWLQQHLVDDASALHRRAAGLVILQHLRPLAISSSEIRELIGSGRSPRYLLPDAVWERIKSAGLYGYDADNQE